MEFIDTFITHAFDNDTFWKYAVAQDRLVIDGVIILKLVEEMELIDAFVIHAFAIDIFWKHAEAHNRLVMDAVTILTFKAK